MPGIVKMPGACGVTRTTIDEVARVAPLMISIRREWPITRNSSPDTSGSVTGSMPVPELVIVSSADSPMEICDGSMVALTTGAAAKAGAASAYAAVIASRVRTNLVLITSPILDGTFRRLVRVLACRRHSGRAALVSLRRVEQLAGFFATHLPG